MRAKEELLACLAELHQTRRTLRYFNGVQWYTQAAVLIRRELAHIEEN